MLTAEYLLESALHATEEFQMNFSDQEFTQVHEIGMEFFDTSCVDSYDE